MTVGLLPTIVLLIALIIVVGFTVALLRSFSRSSRRGEPFEVGLKVPWLLSLWVKTGGPPKDPPDS